MKWQENGIVLYHSPHGESNLIASVLTLGQGRATGLLRKSKDTPSLGTFVQAHWNARLEHHLGRFQIETIKSLGFDILGNPLKTSILGSALSLCHKGLAERHPYPILYEALEDLLTSLAALEEQESLKKYIFFELLFLRQLGFGLDLSSCAVTGRSDALTYISPKSGRSVSLEAGEAYKDRLFPLPDFLNNPQATVTVQDLREALRILGYFLEKNLFQETALPLYRNHLFERVQKYEDCRKD